MRSVDPTTVPPLMPPPAKKSVWAAPQWSRPGPAYELGKVDTLGVRPNSPAITISVLSSNPVVKQVVEQGRECFVGRWEKFVLQARERVAVRVPRLVVAEVDLDEIHAGLEQSKGHEQRPTERVPTVTVLDRVLGVGHVERAADFRVCKQRHRRLAVGIEPFAFRRRFQRSPLFVDVSQEAHAAAQAEDAQAVRQGQIRRLVFPNVGRLGRVLGLVRESVLGIRPVPETDCRRARPR